jgi:hypothetical protein
MQFVGQMTSQKSLPIPRIACYSYAPFDSTTFGPGNRTAINITITPTETREIMTKPHRKLKKANHGQRAANSKARKAKRRKVRT